MDLFSRPLKGINNNNANTFKHIRNVKHSSRLFITHVLYAFEMFLSQSETGRGSEAFAGWGAAVAAVNRTTNQKKVLCHVLDLYHHPSPFCSNLQAVCLGPVGRLPWAVSLPTMSVPSYPAKEAPAWLTTTT